MESNILGKGVFVVLLSSFIFADKLSEKENELKKIRMEILEKQNMQRKIRIEKSNIEKELKKLNTLIKEKEMAIKNLNKKIKSIYESINAVNSKIYTAEVELSDKKSVYNNLEIKAIFFSLAYGEPLLDAFFALGGSIARDEITKIMEKLTTMKNEMEELKRLKKELDYALLELEGEQKKLALAKGEKEELLKNKKASELAIEMELKELENKKKELDELITRLKLKKKYAEVTAEALSLRGKLAMPVKGSVVEKFGRKKHESLDIYIFNSGIRIKAYESTVKSVYDGVVLYAGRFKEYGNMVIIEHPMDIVSIYAGLDSINVSEKMSVKKDTKIGSVSDVLYFELRIGGKPYDPLEWF